MYHLNCFLDENQEKVIKDISTKTGLGVTGVVRRLVECLSPLHGMVLSGAMITEFRAVTTSGKVCLGRGF